MVDLSGGGLAPGVRFTFPHRRRALPRLPGDLRAASSPERFVRTTFPLGRRVFCRRLEAINAAPENIVLAPTCSHYSTSIYASMQEEIDRKHNWTYGCYEKHIADELAKMVFFSSGVFAARPKSRVWKRWEEEIARIVPLVARINPSVLHLAEQTALNGVVRMDTSVTVLDPLCNFHCNAGGVRRDGASGKVVSALVHPNREISIVHLANWRLRRDEYIQAKLTFRPDSPPRTA